jgi:hypothetical protein
MPEYEVDGNPVYDHETEDARSARRRPVADWGVGEELFDHMPRRRFGRPSDPHRRDSHPRERSGSAHAEDFPSADEPAERRPTASDRLERAPTEDLGAPASHRAAALAEAEASAEPAARPEPAAPAEPTARVDAVDGRRTIVIGRSVEPDGVTRRPRRPRTVRDRVGHRPDRIAMWAVALGMLLILIAILTAGA